MNRIAAAALVGAALGGCVTAKIDQTFKASDGEYIFKAGTARIEGSAFLRQRGGGTVTAAGNDITLFPVTEYSTARINVLYRGQKQSYLGAIIEGTPDEYMKQVRTTKADVDGRFTFEKLYPGDYYLTTTIRWAVPGSYLPEGGNIYERVSVKANETARVVMSGN